MWAYSRHTARILKRRGPDQLMILDPSSNGGSWAVIAGKYFKTYMRLGALLYVKIINLVNSKVLFFFCFYLSVLNST